MAGIGDQGDRIRQKAKAALDHHENQIEAHRDGHSGIDALSGDAMSMAMPAMIMLMPAMVLPAMVMVMVMLMLMVMAWRLPAVIVLFHAPHLTLIGP